MQQQQQTLLDIQKDLEDDETEMMSTLGLIRGPKTSPNKLKKEVLIDGKVKEEVDVSYCLFKIKSFFQGFFRLTRIIFFSLRLNRLQIK